MTPHTTRQRALAVAAVWAGVLLFAAGSPYFWAPLALVVLPLAADAALPAAVTARPRRTPGRRSGMRPGSDR
ncbi:hypothetical protein ABZW18_17225 [Streptomyces sp. NPDC004647]|uniref:hypothetical protein n=1 Tax=Streptomyces sp. NPDC004647 TaxID=3154671 RepID=UPI0033AFF7C4